MCNYDNILSDLLTQTDNSYVIINFSSFRSEVIYEEDVSVDYKRFLNRMFLLLIC